MDFYVVLGVATVIITLLAIEIWRRSRSVSFPVGIGLLYYWTLYGGWALVWREQTAGAESSYLYEKLFPIRLDRDYLTALILYSLFIVVIEIVVLIRVRRPSARPPRVRRLRISHTVLLCVIAAAGLLSYCIVAGQLTAARDLGASGYLMTRGVLTSASPLYTIHQVLLRLALVPLALGLAVALSGVNARYVVGSGRTSVVMLYLLELILMFTFCVAIGNRHEFFVAAIAGVLLYLGNASRSRAWLLLLVLFGVVIGLEVIEFSRRLAIAEILQALDSKLILSSMRSFGSGTERFAAHFSLYGVLHYRVPLTYGSSIISFLASAVPRLLWPSRPPDIYVYYATSVGAIEGQGYTIHHATGWYLNFGVLGIVLGAVLFGLVWVMCFNRLETFARGSLLGRSFSAVAPWMFTSAIPTLVRGGPEGYKGLIVESFLIATTAFFIASIRWSEFFVTRVPRRFVPSGRLRHRLIG